MHQMGRDMNMHTVPGGLQDRAQDGNDRALAVGPGDMDDGRQAAFRMAELGQQGAPPSPRR